MINGGVFLGSIVLYDIIIEKFIMKLLGITIVEAAFKWIYYLLWIYPIYGGTLILNNFWVADIFQESQRLYKRKMF